MNSKREVWQEVKKECSQIFIITIIFLLELGDGWGPEFVGDNEELELFNRIHTLLNDDRSFWIGGMAHESIESQGYSDGEGKELKYFETASFEKNAQNKIHFKFLGLEIISNMYL